MLFVCHPKILHKHCLQFLVGLFQLPRETEGNACAKFWGDKQGALWYVMVFSVVVKKSIIIGYVCEVTFRNQRLNYHRRWYPKSNLKGLKL